jgi:hypothetical protein
MFPDEFALRGYPQYPDSSDVHKPLYGILKRRGLVRAAQKAFGLTAKGVETASRLVSNSQASLDEPGTGDRITRDIQTELDRMLASAAFGLFERGDQAKILDTDFYNFIGCTVRTPPNDFLGRIAATGDAISAAVKLSKPDRRVASRLEGTWKFLQKQFKPQIDRRRERR